MNVVALRAPAHPALHRFGDLRSFREQFGLLKSVSGECRVFAMGLESNFVVIGRARCCGEAIYTRWRLTRGQVAWAHAFEPCTPNAAKSAYEAALRALDREGDRANKHTSFFQMRRPWTRAEVLALMRPVIAAAKDEDARRWPRKAAA